jgi:hypothetical protein
VQICPSCDHTGTPPGVGGLSPLDLLHDVGVGLLDQLAKTRQRLAAPVAELLDLPVDLLGGGFGVLAHLSPLLKALGERESI